MHEYVGDELAGLRGELENSLNSGNAQCREVGIRHSERRGTGRSRADCDSQFPFDAAKRT